MLRDMATEVFSVPASTSLLNEVNKLASGRRKTQDGTIGDRAHMERVSDHNLDEIGNTGTSSDADKIPEVHARDIDARGPWPDGWSMMRIVWIIVARCAVGAEKRLKYIIFDGWIWSASSDWARKKYDGADQHHEHAHFSFKYGSGSGTSNPENITSPWGILAAYEQEQDMDEAQVRAAVQAELEEFFGGKKLTQDPKTKGYDSGGGRSVHWHDINGRPAWQVLDGTFKLCQAMAAKLDVPLSDVLAAVGQVDEQVLATLADAGKSDEDVAASLRAALGDRAGAIGRLLAGE